MRLTIGLAIWKRTSRLAVLPGALGFATLSALAQNPVPVFKSDVREVSIVFRVVDKENRPIAGLKPDDIRVEDEGIPRKITSFQANVGNAQIVILPDVSGSMSTVLESLKGALADFADIVSQDFDREPGDILLSLVPFGDTATVLIDRTSNPSEFKRAVARLRPSGSTALVDSVMAALLNAFGARESESPSITEPGHDDGVSLIPSRYRRKPPPLETHRSKFLVIFTDAGENSSTHRWSDIASALLGGDVVIYSIEFDSGAPDSDFSALSKLTQQSGGKVYRGRPENIKRLYAEVAHDIRSHYQLTFSVGDVGNLRSWRNIRLSTNNPGAAIFARTGYCPETPCQRTDASFVGVGPKTWNDVLALSRDPKLVSFLRQRLQELKLEYTPETEKVVRELAYGPLLIEKVWNSERRRAGDSERPSPTLLVRKVENGSRLVGIDSEVCGLALDPEAKSLAQHSGSRDSFSAPANERVLTVLDPEIRIARRPDSAQAQTDAPGQIYFQSQALFYLRDPSGRIPRIRVQCNRPHFLIGDDLVQFASQSMERALKVRSLSASEGVPASEGSSKVKESR
jgi:VWFA-related protein